MKLSIIIPYYKRLKEITRLMAILEPQLTKETEVIIIDDGCNEKELDKFNAKVIHLEENSGGASIPRNIGLDNATGEYIAFVDSDDLVKPNYIKRILEKTKEQWDYCYISWECKKYKIRIYQEPPAWNCCIWNCIYKRSLIGNTRFDPSLKMAEDYKFNKEVRKGKRANIIDILYYYEIDSQDSLTKQGIVYNEKYKEKE